MLHSGPQQVSQRRMMKQSAVIKVLGSLCLLLADGLSVFEDFPEIIGPERIQIKVYLAEPLILHCDALTNCAVDEALIYWLVNDSFPDDTPDTHRITESNENTFEDGAIVQRSLLLKNITAEDLKSTFKCIVTNAVGVAQKTITLHTKTSCD